MVNNIDNDRRLLFARSMIFTSKIDFVLFFFEEDAALHVSHCTGSKKHRQSLNAGALHMQRRVCTDKRSIAQLLTFA